MQAQTPLVTSTIATQNRELTPMRRPIFGKAGRPIPLETNFFQIFITPRQVISQYSVSIWRKHGMGSKEKPETYGKSFSSGRCSQTEWTDVSNTAPISHNRGIFAQFCQKYGHSFGCSLAYDGRSIAFASGEIQRSCLGVMYQLVIDRKRVQPVSEETRKMTKEQFQVKIEHIRNLQCDKLLDSGLDPASTLLYLSGLNIVMEYPAVRGHVKVGRSFYSDYLAKPLGRHSVTASAWRGFYQSVRFSQLGLVLNLDESFTAFWNKGGRPLMDLIKDVNGNDPFSCDFSLLKKLTNALQGLKVRANHTGIVYTVRGFSNRGADRIQFHFTKKRRMVSISEYFANYYNIQLQYGALPCVKVNARSDAYLPIELLTVVERQRVVGVLKPYQTNRLVRIASSKPEARKKTTIRTMKRVNHSGDNMCQNFGVKIDTDMVKTEGRVLPTPQILYTVGPVKPFEGVWRPHSDKFLVRPAPLNTWAVVNITDLGLNDVKEFIKDLVAAAKRSGMSVGNPQPPVFRTRKDRIADEMRKLTERFRHEDKLRIEDTGLQLIVIIQPRRHAPTYNVIKRIADSELGIATQVLLQKHCEKQARDRSFYCDNVVLKINSKLGGQNWHVAPYQAEGFAKVPDVKFLNTPHMVLGADVTHPERLSNSPSVAALVGTRDRDGVQYSASIRNQAGRKEIIEKFGEMFKEVYAPLRKNFGNRWHAETLIIFRDGVSHGQFKEVMQVELAAIRKACTEISSSCRPKITYIIVTKRHHTRFFARRPNVDRSGNILPGTVVDKDITSPEYYDFYLNSHAGIQGTNKPAKYTVLIDENNIDVDALQGYVFRLAHGFVRCNRSVSMVNSVYYAHLLASRGRAYLGDSNRDNSFAGSPEEKIPDAVRIHPLLSKCLFFV